MIRKGWSAMPLPKRRGPSCEGPDCYMTNGPCQPGCHPDARAVQQPVSQEPEHTQLSVPAKTPAHNGVISCVSS